MNYFLQNNEDLIENKQDLVKKYLTFLLGDKIYAIGVLKIREIIEYDTITPIPRMPKFLAGAINLRGQIVPVIDLMEQLGIGSHTITPRSCIVVVMLSNEEQQVIAGIIVDAVSKVLDFEVSEIEQAPDFGGKINTAFIEGMGKTDNDFTLILDVDRILSLEELETLKDVDPDSINDTEFEGSSTKPELLQNQETIDKQGISPAAFTEVDVALTEAEAEADQDSYKASEDSIKSKDSSK